MRLTATTTHKTLVALLASSFLWACQNEYLPYINNKPGTPKEVQLVFSSSGELQDTRMTAVNGNENGKLKNLSFIPYAITADADAVTKDNRRLDGIINFNQNDFQNTVFQNVSVPIGTNSFLVYGEDSDNKEEGKLVLQLNKETSTIEISLVPISPKNEDIYNNIQTDIDLLNSFLTEIAMTEGWEGDVDTKAIRDEFLGLQAGSSKNVLAAVQDLYSRVEGATDESSISYKIKQKILENTDADASGILSFEEGMPTEHPIKNGLPAGAAAICWDSGNKKFINAATTISPLKVAPSEYYAFPAALWYHANSRIRTSTKKIEEVVNGGINSTGDDAYWQNIVNLFNNQDNTPMKGSVSTATQAIIIEDRMQYGVARMDLRVNAASNELEDNSGTTNPSIRIPNKETFPLTGILVGGQDKVNFSFRQFENASPEYIIYDKNVQGLHLYHYDSFNDTDTKTASTLLLQSQKTPKDKDGNLVPIMIALEFENRSGKSFVGVDSKIIANGCKFYLIGELVPEKEGDCVFQQDKITKVDVTVNSLRNAYYIIPDLRDPQLRIGVTVDNWILSTPSGPIVM